MEYDLEYFIQKFEAIPEDKWCMEKYTDGKGCYCAYGHCGMTVESEETVEAEKLSAIIRSHGDLPYVLASINDGVEGDYFGSTPKQRVINYLKSLRK